MAILAPYRRNVYIRQLFDNRLALEKRGRRNGWKSSSIAPGASSARSNAPSVRELSNRWVTSGRISETDRHCRRLLRPDLAIFITYRCDNVNDTRYRYRDIAGRCNISIRNETLIYNQASPQNSNLCSVMPIALSCTSLVAVVEHANTFRNNTNRRKQGQVDPSIARAYDDSALVSMPRISFRVRKVLALCLFLLGNAASSYEASSTPRDLRFTISRRVSLGSKWARTRAQVAI